MPRWPPFSARRVSRRLELHHQATTAHRLTRLFGLRPLLEFRVAERVRALPNAAVRDGVRVDRLHKDGRNTVAGVRLTSPGTPDRAEEIGCDLVVNATGRGSATPRWLAEQGFAPPREDLLPARVTYATCMFPRGAFATERVTKQAS